MTRKCAYQVVCLREETGSAPGPLRQGGGWLAVRCPIAFAAAGPRGQGLVGLTPERLGTHQVFDVTLKALAVHRFPCPAGRPAGSSAVRRGPPPCLRLYNAALRLGGSGHGEAHRYRNVSRTRAEPAASGAPKAA